MIPTAEEFFRNKIKELHPLKEVVVLSGDLITAEQAMIWANEYSVLKSKHHVVEALQCAIENIGLKESSSEEVNANDICPFITADDDTIWIIDKDLVLSCYPLENIK